MKRLCSSALVGCGALSALLTLTSPARAEGSAFEVSLDATADLTTQLSGGQPGSDFTGIVRIKADLDLEQALGWHGAKLHGQGIASFGNRPNDRSATLQGVNNIEVPENRAKLFEFYLEERFGESNNSLRIGFSDLNAEFYSTDSSGLLVAPAFGIGSELSASGPNGPSLFPSTALTARLHFEDQSGRYAEFAVVNAEAGVLGDTGGMRPLFGKGALVIGEVGRGGKGKLALGGWSYTQRQEDLRDLDPTGNPVRRSAYGGYVLIDMPLGDKAGLFARAGISDGKTTPFTGGWQAGVMVEAPFAGRPDGMVSFGVNQAYLSSRFRANMADAGTPMGPSETGLELTYSDQVLPGTRIQPDLQWISKADRGPGSRHALVGTLRLTASY